MIYLITVMYLLHINNYVKQIFDDKLTASGTIAYFKALIAMATLYPLIIIIF